MDSWEWNKIAGAVLGAVLFVMVVNFAADAIYDNPPPAKPSYTVEMPQAPVSSATAVPEAEPIPDFANVLPAADVTHGKEVAARCLMCHDLAKGGPTKIGPNLWAVVDRPRAAAEHYSYSSAMRESHDPWTNDKLFVFLKSPMVAVPGTKMSFAGVRSAKDRIDLIAYLRTLSDNPH